MSKAVHYARFEGGQFGLCGYRGKTTTHKTEVTCGHCKRLLKRR